MRHYSVDLHLKRRPIREQARRATGHDEKDIVPRMIETALDVAQQTRKSLAAIDRIKEQAFGSRHQSDRFQHLICRYAVAVAAMVFIDVDLLRRDRRTTIEKCECCTRFFQRSRVCAITRRQNGIRSYASRR